MIKIYYTRQTIAPNIKTFKILNKVQRHLFSNNKPYVLEPKYLSQTFISICRFIKYKLQLARNTDQSELALTLKL